ncbi:MAG: hypothetical protein H6R13_463 [Proteobacteria bacterium]|nr:hypothetical protein [Pseudomonadota bacterium]
MTPSTERWAPLGIAVLMMTLCACSPDQPPSAGEKLSPVFQSTLREMNALGAQGNRQQTYAYALAENCDLRATKSLNAYPIKQMAFLLRDTRFERYDYAPGLGYAVRSVNQGVGTDEVVFDAFRLESIQAMLELLIKIKAECLGASAPGDHVEVRSPG